MILAVDQGTTGTTCLLVDPDGGVRGRGYREITQHFPRPGWVEHDPEEIWDSVLEATRQALNGAGIRPDQVAAVGITNQRETVVVWDRASLRPLHRAIVWQDRRTTDDCRRLAEAGWEARVAELTGLTLDPYFSATKLAWLLARHPELAAAAAGTVDSWLIARMSGGRAHLTDASNASRTLLFDIRTGAWSPELGEILGVDPSMLPEVTDSSGELARTDPEAFAGIDASISGVAGDQQAALFGQACHQVGMAKNTYGTGSFVLLNTGPDPRRSSVRMLTTVAWRMGGRLTHALEGSIFVTGAAVQWLRDGLGLIHNAAETAALAESVPDTGGVYLVPAFAGLGAPYWDPAARGTLIGLTRGTGRAHIARAALEAMAYQTRDVLDAMAADLERPLTELRVDGGAAANDFLCQFQADLLGIPVLRPTQTETTALGAAYLAGLGAGIWSELDQVSSVWRLGRRFEPRLGRDRADAMQAGWRRAVERSLGWAL